MQGNVIPSRFELLRNWKRDYTIEHVLMELRRDMATSANRKLQQPQEGALY
jgi:ubiquitin-conjugating enzyme E2 variant